MLTRFLTLSVSILASLGLVAYVALRSGPLSSGGGAGPPVTAELDVPATSPVHSASSRGWLESPAGHAATGRPIDVSERQFDRLASRGLVLVKFGAEWCPPCRMIVPELERLAADNGALTVLTVDVDREKRLKARHGVGSIPRMILFRDGEQIDSWVGFEYSHQMQARINRARPPAPAGKVQSNPFL
jgi:thioredoxin 1